MQVKRFINQEGSYDYHIYDENKILKIFFSGNLDLYWHLHCTTQEDILNHFLISKENYTIYTIFKKLYENIKFGKIYNNKTLDERVKHLDAFMKINANNSVIWLSDDRENEKGNSVIISENEKGILLTFYMPEPFKSIRFSNSGSRYYPFNIAFMKMFRMLQEYDPDIHQTHLAEFEYIKERKK